MYEGGGLYLMSGNVFNCLITGNSASQGGGGVYCRDFYGTLSNCTIYGNTGHSGQAIYSDWGSSPVVVNCILRWISSGIDFYRDSSISITYSCVQDGFEGEGNISSNPFLATGQNGDYYLSHIDAGQAADSPCVDAGSDGALALGLEGHTTRTDGLPDTGIVDMGFHYPTNVTVSCSLNDDYFIAGDAIVGSLAVTNSGLGVVVDVYLGFVLPDGSVVSFSDAGLVDGLRRLQTGASIPAGFSFGPEAIFELQVPDYMMPGDYIFAAMLTSPDTFSPMSFSAWEFEIR